MRMTLKPTLDTMSRMSSADAHSRPSGTIVSPAEQLAAVRREGNLERSGCTVQRPVHPSPAQHVSPTVDNVPPLGAERAIRPHRAIPCARWGSGPRMAHCWQVSDPPVLGHGRPREAREKGEERGECFEHGYEQQQTSAERYCLAGAQSGARESRDRGDEVVHGHPFYLRVLRTSDLSDSCKTIFPQRSTAALGT
jgi:hypothetical protein